MAKESHSKDLQECIKLMREMTTIIDPADDYLTISAAEEQMQINYEKGKRQNEEAYTNLKALSKVLDAARKSSTRPPSVPTAAQHAAHLNELDATRLSLAKAIRDAESALASKEAEVAALKEQTRALEASDPARDHQQELDGTPLRLQIYRGLGFNPIADEDGNIRKILITSESGDIHCIPHDAERSDYHDANTLWELAAS
ncbi:hypothetical protein BJ138DRAFT_1084213 [Hygrophoropsis aurantiaca]|uniref:Uncharacterized protein n=1 Tax=Hygrophoropsis aurantiaca TaxID=72124 RepID=A0ACB8AFN6_9AGAM|nr:hypothetical protein BJ138DRAFT_1084213 [Hygrophoropsis aurantiaca]